MQRSQWAAFVFIIATVVVRGFWPEEFFLDSYSVGLVFLLAIPLLAPFLKKAKWFGAEFDFKENIQQLVNLVEESREEKREIEEEKRPVDIIETFSAESAMNLVEQDPNLALAALRIEIERILRLAYHTLIDPDSSSKNGIGFLVKKLHEHDTIGDHQRDAIHQITKLCNEAVHGGKVSIRDAIEVINLTIELSQSFSLGYSINFQPNPEYEEQGLLCEWEHCVEHFPLRENRDDRSCHVFGHDCPGGIGTRAKCHKSIDDLPDEWFAKS
ncbi:MAG: DUF4145 domain-containing protein [bacterium]